MFKFYAVTDKGIVRDNNEDAYFVPDNDAPSGLFVVADGMGGHNCGEVASRIAVDSFVSSYNSSRLNSDVKEALISACAEANAQVYTSAQSDETYMKMGTTLVGCVLDGVNAYIINVGDSRGYIYSRGVLRKITKDHSAVQEMVDAGILTVDGAKHHPHRNIITRAIGTDITVECDVFSLPFGQDDIIILCTDGLTEMVGEESIAAVVEESTDIESMCHRLLDEALALGGDDNITVAAACACKPVSCGDAGEHLTLCEGSCGDIQ